MNKTTAMEKIPGGGISPFRYSRFPTRVVTIGTLAMGGTHPVRIQSMVNTAPDDIAGTVQQVVALAAAGCELVRLAVPSVRDAERLPEIREGLAAAGVAVPLVADVHFNPSIAEICARYVEKVRINPGNYRAPGAPARSLTDTGAIRSVMEETEELLVRLIAVCRSHGTVIRVGSNHGSLSPHILHRYGDTPLGMVEGALEFVRIFHRHSFHDLVLSMKSSNVRVMVQAYRLLVRLMEEEGFDYPLHLGVTEAGIGDEGRIRSAAGTGLLLDEGIGDTIRVSLTGDPVTEIPAAAALCRRLTLLQSLPPEVRCPGTITYDPLVYARRKTTAVAGIGGGHPVVVAGRDRHAEVAGDDRHAEVARRDRPVVAAGRDRPAEVAGEVSAADTRMPDWVVYGNGRREWMQPNGQASVVIPLYDGGTNDSEGIPVGERGVPMAVHLPAQPDGALADALKGRTQTILVIPVPLTAHPGAFRAWIALLDAAEVSLPVIARITGEMESSDEATIHAAVTASGIFTDGLADGLWLDTAVPREKVSLSFSILQATRARITTTEYISCPSCGRTRFNIEEAVYAIRDKTSHLTGLKIAVMGCIVNGPGEMADADYGYVGGGNKTITLYKGREVVQRGIPEADAIGALINLIKESGEWTDPQ